MRKLFYYIKMTNITPLHIGNGDNTLTDQDVIKDKAGKFFIPGTTLAGCFRHYLNDEDRKLFNPTYKESKHNDQMFKQSPFFISDALVEEDITYETRDGIALDENKITKDGNKYDYEIVPAGHHFHFRIEVFDRDDNDALELIVNDCLSALGHQDIRLGYKTTRGLGNFEIERVGRCIFDQTNYQDYLSFDPYHLSSYKLYELKELKSRFLNIDVSLKQNGGLSIRTYQTKKEESDFIHIQSNGNSVIPGTSWNGLFRRQFKYYLDLYKDYNSIDLKMSEVFGASLDQEDKVKSNIYFKESIIQDGEGIAMVRNRINRFDSSTIQGSLYKETACYNGKTTLSISLNIESIKDAQKIETIKEILLLIIKDLDQGFIALGGETAIGRGLFKVEKVMIDDECVCLEDAVC